jgi:hypothetical protein
MASVPYDAPTPYNLSSLGFSRDRLAPLVQSRARNTAVATGQPCIPLNLLAHILSFLEDDPATLALLCGTSRVLYYMALPLLWRNVHLYSSRTVRNKKRSRNGEYKEAPEGYGGASPFAAGLDALVTNSSAGKLVQRLTLEGEYEDSAELDRWSRAGRASERTMMLNICVRAALDRCIQLEEFHWRVDTRLLATAYQGLARLARLRCLEVRFPTSKAPQPTTELPVLPALERLVVTDYDPLSYPDDISKVIFEAERLKDLQIHFSTRMRDAGEPSVQPTHLLRRNIKAGRKLKLKRLGTYNLFNKPESELLAEGCDLSTIEDFTSINSFGHDEDDTTAYHTAFLDRGWTEGPTHGHFPGLRVWRVDQLHSAHLRSFRDRRNIEKFYSINPRHGRPRQSHSHDSTPTSQSDASTVSTSSSCFSGASTSTSSRSDTTTLKELYLDVVCKSGGLSLKHLIFPIKWSFTLPMLAKLIRCCPKMTQLSICLDCADPKIWEMLLSFCPSLFAVRVTISDPNEDWRSQPGAAGSLTHDQWLRSEDYSNMIRNLLSGVELHKLRYIGVDDVVWRVEGMEEVPEESGATTPTEELRLRRKITCIPMDEVKTTAIWKFDTVDVI